MNNSDLVAIAKTMLPKAYVPYSNFPVGAAILCEDGTVYTGCNIENASYGVTICAERAAICRAICDGNRKIVKVAVIAETDDYCYPCGACRQVLFEFNPNMKVVCGRRDGDTIEHEITELLPHAFGPSTLNDI